MMTACPMCGHRTVGKVGTEQYYCWDCCVEFSTRGHNVKVFDVQVDGTLTLCANPQNTVNLQVQKG